MNRIYRKSVLISAFSFFLFQTFAAASDSSDLSSWTPSRLVPLQSSSAASVTAPDGSSTRSFLQEDKTSGNHEIDRTTSLASNQQLSVYLYAKAASRSQLRVFLQDSSQSNNYVAATFDLSKGQASSLTQSGVASSVSYSITNQGNGWYLCVLSGILDSSSAPARAVILLGSSGYAGDGSSGLYVWKPEVQSSAPPGPLLDQQMRSFLPETKSIITQYAAYSTYSPQFTPSNYDASTLAFYGRVALKGYQLYKDSSYLSAAAHLARSIAEYPDMNGDGRWGWGDYWSASGPSRPGDGSNTTFSQGCDPSLARNKAYDIEIYYDGLVIPLLIETGVAAGDQHLIDVARKAIDDSWDIGAPTADGKGFYYWKTEGPCQIGWQVKNINVQMAVGLFEMYKVLQAQGDPGAMKYYTRGLAVLRAEFAEYNYTGYPGISSGVKNYGYYGIATDIAHRSDANNYVKTIQTIPTTGNPIVECSKDTTGSNGKSCAAHLGIEVQSLLEIASIMGSPTLGGAVPNLLGLAKDILSDFARIDQAGIYGTTAFPSDPTYDNSRVGYFCEAWQLDPSFAQLCSSRLQVSEQQSVTGVVQNVTTWFEMSLSDLSSPLLKMAPILPAQPRYLYLPIKSTTGDGWRGSGLKTGPGGIGDGVSLIADTSNSAHYAVFTLPLSAGFSSSDVWKFSWTARLASGSGKIGLRGYVIDSQNSNGYAGMRCFPIGTAIPSVWQMSDASNAQFTATPVSGATSYNCSVSVRPDSLRNGSVRLEFYLENLDGLTFRGDGVSGVAIENMLLEANPENKVSP